MKQLAFKMKLKPGFASEYKKRHDRIWEELATLLKERGIEQYSIFLDEQTNDLFATFKIDDPRSLDDLPAQLVMKKWWEYMSDIMHTNPDNSPVSSPLKEVFYLS
jgi:L-rhamnose mutarotase